jgi:CarboxypepD_reg-like domain
MKHFFTPFLILLSTIQFLQAQTEDHATIFGKVTDALTGEPIEFVTVYIKDTNVATESNTKGEYVLKVPVNERLTIVFTRIGYKEGTSRMNPLSNGASRKVDVILSSSESNIEVVVTESRIQEGGMIRENVEQLKLLPSTTGNFESLLPAIALGTSSGTGGELSSQYNVRGGNYDENLVYVNDFEIYRPQLIRAGQQEGLTFPNIDLIRDLSFSSGGFEAKYGDKLSSVLDIKYKRPDSLRASVGLSFLGGSAHVEGSFKAGKTNYNKVRYLIGARYKTTKYLLGTLDIEGEYTPNFADIQAYITYDINRNWQVGLMGNYNRSEYQFIPTTRNTALGLIDFALELFTVFDGQEIDDFTTGMGGVSLTYLPDRDYNPYFLKFLASTYKSNENERIDITGDYLLGQIESGLGSDDFGEVVAVLGTGTQQQFVRNSLQSTVTNVEHKGGIEFQIDNDDLNSTSSHFVQWSVKAQNEKIDDQLNEWERLDSAGYSLRYDTSEVLVYNVLKTQNSLNSYRFNAYLQDTYTIQDTVKEMKISFGVRASYWDLNKEFFVSPRAQFLYKPLKWKKDISFRLATGLYYQSPFYRELRDREGVVHENTLSQKSVHIVGGLTWDFYSGKNNPKKFRLISEIYYKKLWDMISYDVDNVRIRYSGVNDATGYVAGFDLRLNGEFVPGAESWINLSLLRARESLDGVQHLKRDIGDPEATEVKDVPRPTDQFLTLSMFFQDYLPMNENFKMHLNFTVGTGLPYGLPENNVIYRNTYRFPAYHRVDIGFSFQLWEEARKASKPNHPLRFSRSTWLSLEIFNLLQVANVASNTWIKTIYNTQYAIPNFLTSRRINLRLKMDF